MDGNEDFIEEQEIGLSETDNANQTKNFEDSFDLEKTREQDFKLKQLVIEPQEVRFSVVCAHTHLSDNEKYVVYSIMIECEESERPALLERRYSDFLSLWIFLQNSYPALTNQISFPKKAIVGNFTMKLIEERSHSFEELLSYVYSKDVLRCSETFMNFLCRRELQESSHFLLNSQFEDAIPVLENIYCLLCRVKGDKNLLLRVLLQLIVSLHAVSNYELAYDYSLLALPRFEHRFIEGNYVAKDLYVPFLIFCTRLWWMLGKDRTLLEANLEKEGKKTDSIAELLDILRDDINLPSLSS